MHELALLAGLALGAVLAEDQDLGVGDRLADRVGPSVDLCRVQIGRPERLGEPVHQVRLRLEGRSRAGSSSVGRRHPACRCWRSSACSPSPRRATPGRRAGPTAAGTQVSPVTRCLALRAGRRPPVAGSSSAPRGHRPQMPVVSWLSPASKLSGRTARMQSSPAVAEILAHALAADEQVAVRQHDPLRLPGAPRRVEDRRHVEVDPAPLAVRPRRRSAPSNRARAHGRSGGGSGTPPTTITCSTDEPSPQLVAKQLQPLRRRDQDADAAVAEDVADLMRAQQRVDRNEDAAGGRGAEERDDRLDPLVEVDGHPLAALEPELAQPGAEREQPVGKLGVGQRGVLEGQRRCRRRGGGRSR